jgi:hypothetical protein
MNKRPYTKVEIQDAVSNSKTFSDVYRNLNLKINGGSYNWMKNLIRKFGIDTSHFLTRSEIGKLGSTIQRKNYIYSLTKSKDISRSGRIGASRLQNFMAFQGIKHKCNCCGLTEWNGKPIRLDIDHIDGNPEHNHIDNLQFLCPNCHRQKTIQYSPSFLLEKAETVFKSSRRLEPKKKNFCLDCGCEVTKEAERCMSCSKKGFFKINWPSNSDMEKLVWEIPTSILSKQLGVSDTAISRHCKERGIKKPGRGYWQKKYAVGISKS